MLSDSAWQRLRHLDPRAAERDERRRPAEGKAAKAVKPSQEERLARMDLRELARHFGTDKWGGHRYAPHYQRHLEHLKEERFTLFEIGIGGYAREKQGGASLRMWKAFFPNAQIVGLDIEDKSFVEQDRIRAYRGSQADSSLIRTIVEDSERMMVVVDDGSHRPEHIRATFEALIPLLPDGAIYCIEDLQTSYWPEWGGSEDREDPDTSMGLVKSLVDGLNYEEFIEEPYIPSYTDKHVVAVHCYHNLVVIEKGRNEEGTKKRTILRDRYVDAPAPSPGGSAA